MIAFEELLEMKRRMIVAAESARRIATAPDSFVFYDKSEYEAVVVALVALPEDLRRLLAEHDLMRARCAEEWQDLFFKGVQDGNARDGGKPVGQVPDDASGGSGPAAGDDNAGTDRPVQDERPARRRSKRSKSKRDSQAEGVDPQAVGHGDGAAAVDRGEGDA